MNDDTTDAWITEMTTFLTMGLPPEHMSVNQESGERSVVGIFVF